MICIIDSLYYKWYLPVILYHFPDWYHIFTFINYWRKLPFARYSFICGRSNICLICGYIILISLQEVVLSKQTFHYHKWGILNLFKTRNDISGKVILSEILGFLGRALKMICWIYIFLLCHLIVFVRTDCFTVFVKHFTMLVRYIQL
jgi:hypothetical protein